MLIATLSCTKIRGICMCSPFLRADIKVSCHLSILIIFKKFDTYISCLEQKVLKSYLFLWVSPGLSAEQFTGSIYTKSRCEGNAWNCKPSLSFNSME